MDFLTVEYIQAKIKNNYKNYNKLLWRVKKFYKLLYRLLYYGKNLTNSISKANICNFFKYKIDWLKNYDNND